MKRSTPSRPPLIIQGYNSSGKLIEAVIMSGKRPSKNPIQQLAKSLAKSRLRPIPLSRILSGEHTFLLKDAQHWIDRAYYTVDFRATRKNGYYTNRKWVRQAGSQAHQGLKVALTTLLGKPLRGQTAHAYFQERLALDHPALLPSYLAVYEALVHQLIGKGHRRVGHALDALENAESMVDQVAVILEEIYMESPSYLSLTEPD